RGTSPMRVAGDPRGNAIRVSEGGAACHVPGVGQPQPVVPAVDGESGRRRNVRPVPGPGGVRPRRGNRTVGPGLRSVASVVAAPPVPPPGGTLLRNHHNTR